MDAFEMTLVDPITLHLVQSLIIHGLQLKDVPAVFFLLDGPRSVGALFLSSSREITDCVVARFPAANNVINRSFFFSNVNNLQN